jgi:hypothetical protein
MTQPPDRGDLQALYERGPTAPVATGDRVAGERVIGFALTREPETDQMLVDGEENLSGPPHRPVPCHGGLAGIERTGSSPVHEVPARFLSAPARLSAKFDVLLSSFGPKNEQVIRSLLNKVADMGHHAWCVGGAVRDLLAAGPDAKVNDLDVAGTIGPGCLNKIAVAPLRRNDAGDYECRISARLVWSLRTDLHSRPLLEYKALARSVFRFPAWGGSLAEDTATRDLTINALYYDLRNNVLADPSGQGRAHLCSAGAPMVAATPYRGDDPAERACIILRIVKFKLRWPDLDITQVAGWVKDLPGDLVERIPQTEWDRIITTRERCVQPEHRGDPEMTVAGELGPVAKRLIAELQARP